ncbi:KpsF/GutQ family sugar-phosphate isomerase [bacterium]|nr:KpsF/GutQ family sugar-phosphate isomerase [bacterium]
MNLTDTAKSVLDIEAQAILRIKENLDEKEFNKAIDAIYNCKGRLIITGMGKSGHIGKKIAATFSSTGTPSYFLHPAESTHGDSGVITRDDVVIAISNSGESQELLNLLPLLKRFGLTLIAMTGNPNSTLGKASDIIVDISVEKEACPLGKAPTASTTVTLAVGDALAMCLLEKKGFTQEDFLIFHPSGALGKGFTYRVSDLMRTENLPIAQENELFTDVIETISEHKLGLALIVNEQNILSGILTDGDIRRNLIKHKNVSNLKVTDAMTKSPKTVKADSYAASALHLMEKYSITALPITDENGKPAGIVHVHDLLKAGVA